MWLGVVGVGIGCDNNLIDRFLENRAAIRGILLLRF